jgi:hypothetical protein
MKATPGEESWEGEQGENPGSQDAIEIEADERQKFPWLRRNASKKRRRERDVIP